MADKYRNMVELKQNENKWSIITSKKPHPILSLAPHGGGIEAGTSELALLVSQKLQCSYYTFKGQLDTGNSILHVTSTHYDEPTALDISKTSEYTISIHGCVDTKQSITYIGGTNVELIDLFKKYLQIGGFNVIDAPSYLGGKSNKNIANRNINKSSVQLELSTQQRRDFFENGDYSKDSRENVEKWSSDMYRYAQAIEWAVREYMCLY